MSSIDPLLPHILAGRTIRANNELRAKMMFDIAVGSQRDRISAEKAILEQLEFSQQEAMLRNEMSERENEVLIENDPARRLTSS